MHACAVESAEALDARVTRGEAAAERNIDEAAAQVEGAIGAASERLQGVMEDAPRQTAAVVQSVRKEVSFVMHPFVMHCCPSCCPSWHCTASVVGNGRTKGVLNMYAGVHGRWHAALHGCVGCLHAGALLS